MPQTTELAKRRAAMGHSQEKLAELIGVHRSTIVRWEAGRGDSSYARNQEALATALDVNYHQLQLLFANRPIDAIDASEINDREGLLGLSFPDPDNARSSELQLVDPQSILALLDQLSAVDNNAGPATVLPLVVSQHERITRLLNDHRHRTPEALFAASRFAEFRGWLHHDLGQLDLALRWTSTAVDLSMEAGDDQLTAYNYMRKSNIASDAHRQELSIRYAQMSRLHVEMLSPRVRAVALRQEAQANALLGNGSECSRLIDEAHHLVATNDRSINDIAVYCSENYIEMEAANAWIELDRYTEAIPILESADKDWSRDFRRDHGLCKSRLALAYAGNAEPGLALVKAEEGAAIAKTSGSERSWHILKRTASELQACGASDEAAQLRQHLPLAS